MARLSRHKTGLAVGIFAATLHALWAVIVGFGAGQSAINWLFSMHFLQAVWIVKEFSLGRAVGLVATGLVCGYIVGWFFTAVWNWVNKK